MYYTKADATGQIQSVQYAYDVKNNLTGLTEAVGNSTQGYTYTYDENNRITSVTVGDTTVTYRYDAFSRLIERETKQGDTIVKTEAYTFVNWTDSNNVARTTSQIATYAVTVGGTTTTYSYTYDLNGNILTISDGTYTTSYVYDSANQLIEEYNEAEEYAHFWVYDNAGNIKSRTEYRYENDTLGELIDTVNYGYNDEAWGDLLTSYDNQQIEYDGIGNPEEWGNRTFTWERGRQLASLTENGTTWTYTYNADGMRTSRTGDGKTYTYTYNGSQLVQMAVGSDTLRFTYDAAGTPLTVTYDDDTYYYVTNVQGDVVAIVNASGTKLVEYTYSSWGVVLQAEGVVEGENEALADALADLNPLRYRGYVYDTETALYYLLSRYYDPDVGRFINADTYSVTGQGFSGNNMFAYCGNNPVMHTDVAGNFWDIVFDVVSLVISVVDVVNNPTDPCAWIGLAGDVIDVFVPLVSGVGEVTKVASAALDVADNVYDASRAVDNASDIIDTTGDVSRIATTGTPNQIGKMGEQLAGIDPTAKTPISINGRTRIPDSLTETTLIEVKNVQYISNTKQLRDFSDYASQAGLGKTLYVRPTTKIAQTVLDSGWDIKYLW